MYAKLKSRFPVNGLNPGRWYPVVSWDQGTGVVSVRCDEENQGLEVHESLVEIRREKANYAEIYMASTFGQRGPDGRFPEARYRAVCPCGHDLGEVQPTIRDVWCSACGARYEATLSGP
jgi:hypothetical protein